MGMEASAGGIEYIVLSILAGLVISIFGGAIYAFFLAIWLFIFSGGNEEKIKRAWTSLRFMILGIIMTLVFLFVFPVLFQRMRIAWYQAYTAENIFRQSSFLIRSLLDFGKVSVQTYQGSSDSDSLDRPSPPPPPPSGGGLQL